MKTHTSASGRPVHASTTLPYTPSVVAGAAGGSATDAAPHVGGTVGVGVAVVPVGVDGGVGVIPRVGGAVVGGADVAGDGDAVPVALGLGEADAPGLAVGLVTAAVVQAGAVVAGRVMEGWPSGVGFSTLVCSPDTHDASSSAAASADTSLNKWCPPIVDPPDDARRVFWPPLYRRLAVRKGMRPT